MFRDGAKLIGKLPRTGNGSAINTVPESDEEGLVAAAATSNMERLSKLREDAHAARLLQSCVEDAALGRMTPPSPLDLSMLPSEIFSPRFGVEQGGLRI